MKVTKKQSTTNWNFCFFLSFAVRTFKNVNTKHKPAGNHTWARRQPVQSSARLKWSGGGFSATSRPLIHSCAAWCQSVYLHQVQAFLSPGSTNGCAAAGENSTHFPPPAWKQVHTLICPLVNQKASPPPIEKLFFRITQATASPDNSLQPLLPPELWLGQHGRQQLWALSW